MQPVVSLSDDRPEDTGLSRTASIEIAPDSLLGLDGGAVRALLGEPDLRRREASAEIWRYRQGNCALALFFYAATEGDGGGPRVRHFEAWETGGGKAASPACLGNVALRARG